MEEVKYKLLRIIERSRIAIEEMNDDNIDEKIYITNANQTIIQQYWKLYNDYKVAKANWYEKKNIPVE